MRISSDQSKSQIESQTTDQSNEIASNLFLIDQIAGKLHNEGKTAGETADTLTELGFSSEEIARVLRNQYGLK